MRPPSAFSRSCWLSLIAVLIMGSVNLLRATEPAAAAKPDPELEAALKDFHMEGPKGWSYTQTTVAAGQKRVEHYDGGQPEFSRWSLIEQDGRPPTADELEDYMEKNSRRSRGGTAPRLTDQLDMRTLRVVDQNQERTTYRCRLKPAETGDATGKYLEAALVLHRATRTIESFTLEATEPFSPTLGVKIQEMVTVMRYSLPQSDVPSLLQTSITRLRGTAFFFKSLDADRTVTFTDYHRARPQRSQSTVAPASSP